MTIQEWVQCTEVTSKCSAETFRSWLRSKLTLLFGAILIENSGLSPTALGAGHDVVRVDWDWL